MAESLRVFLAIELPEMIRDSVARLRDRLAPEIHVAKWVARSQYHATLAFLGDVPSTDVPMITRVVSEAAGEFTTITLKLASLGAFPAPARPRNIWVGLEGPGLANLLQLQNALVRALSSSGHQPADQGRFSPHVTLARFKVGPGRVSAPDLRPVLAKLGDWSSSEFPVVEVVTYSSQLRPEGPLYTALARSQLIPTN